MAYARVGPNRSIVGDTDNAIRHWQYSRVPDDTVDLFTAQLNSIETPARDSLRVIDSVDVLSQIDRSSHALTFAGASLKKR